MEKHGGNIYRYDHRMYDFSANLNPAGMPAAVSQAVADHIGDYESYPDPDQTELRSTIAEYYNISVSRVCCGNGAADLIFRIALGLKPKKALIVSPTFSEYREALSLAECHICDYILEREDGFRLDDRILTRIRDERPDIIFLCNPNNPTGITVPKDLVISVIYEAKRAGARVVIDECFMEFVMGAGHYSVMSEIERLPNVIILKSFTKYYAMAGLRLGYCICGDPDTADIIRGCMQAWPVSTVCSVAGIAALRSEDPRDEIRASIALQRERLMSGLLDLGFMAWPSEANYIFFCSDFPLDDALRERDILIRNCSNYVGLGDGYYRIAVRTAEENDYFLAMLRQVVSERNQHE